MSAVAAPPIPVNLKATIEQLSKDNPAVQNVIAKIAQIANEYKSGARAVPDFSKISSEEKETKIAQLKALVARLTTERPDVKIDLSSLLANLPSKPAPAQEEAAPVSGFEAFKARLPADFDLEAFKAKLPADFDFEALKAKLEERNLDYEALKAKLANVDFAALKAKLGDLRAAKTDTIPTAPENVDFALAMEKAHALYAAYKANGSIPEGFTISAAPKNLKLKFDESATEGVSADLIAKVKSILASRSSGEQPNVAEALIAKVKAAIASYADDESFSSLGLAEKIQLISVKVNKE
jgi:hypothetical protein